MRITPVMLALCCALSSAAAAETLALVPPSGVNVHPDLLLAAADVLRGQLVRRGVGILTVPGEPEMTERIGTAAVDEARRAGADAVAVLHVTRLGTLAHVRLTVYAASGQIRFVDELPAATPDDLAPVLERLARAYVSGEPAEGNAELASVTEAESAPYAKRRATHVWGLMLGGVATSNPDESAVIPGGSLFWLYDMRSFLAEVAVSLHSREGWHDVSLGLGGFYPFGRRDTAPYLGGGLRWAATSYGGDGASGLQLYAGAGLLIGRLSTVQVRLQAEVFANTYAERPAMDYEDGVASEGGDTFQSHGFTFGVGIGF